MKEHLKVCICSTVFVCFGMKSIMLCKLFVTLTALFLLGLGIIATYSTI